MTDLSVHTAANTCSHTLSAVCQLTDVSGFWNSLPARLSKPSHFCESITSIHIRWHLANRMLSPNHKHLQLNFSMEESILVEYRLVGIKSVQGVCFLDQQSQNGSKKCGSNQQPSKTRKKNHTNEGKWLKFNKIIFQENKKMRVVKDSKNK